MDRKIENKFYDLLALKLSGDASAHDLVQLQNLLITYPQLQFLYDQIHTTSTENQPTDDEIIQAYAAHYIKHIHLTKQEEQDETITPHIGRKHNLKHIWSYAAAAIFLGALFGTYFLHNQKQRTATIPKNDASETVTAKGSKSTVVLPDGTVVTLNADSRLIYGTDFSNKKREASLEGEGFFNVKHDPEHPFIIHTHYADIKVIGTEFNLRNYPSEKKLETSLINGKVEVLLHNNSIQGKIILKPMQKLIIRDNSDSIIQSNTSRSSTIKNESPINLTQLIMRDSTIAETAWVNNKLAFANEPISEITEELGRRFNIKIVFKSDKTKNYRYTGVFDESNLTEIMEILSLSKKINYHLNKEELVIE